MIVAGCTSAREPKTTQRVEAPQLERAHPRAVASQRVVTKPPRRMVKSRATRVSQFEVEVVDLVNRERARGAVCGHERFGPAPPVRLEGHLQRAAERHSADMIRRQFFSHTNPSGESPFDRMEKAGYRFTRAAENIAAGQRSPREVVEAWMNSPGHCRNIMNASFTHTGVGHVASSDLYGHYWTQTFGAVR